MVLQSPSRKLRSGVRKPAAEVWRNSRSAPPSLFWYSPTVIRVLPAGGAQRCTKKVGLDRFRGKTTTGVLFLKETRPDTRASHVGGVNQAPADATLTVRRPGPEVVGGVQHVLAQQLCVGGLGGKLLIQLVVDELLYPSACTATGVRESRVKLQPAGSGKIQVRHEGFLFLKLKTASETKKYILCQIHSGNVI